MNRLWSIIVTVRDFGYHWSVKQYGDGWVTHYKDRMLAFVSGYVLTAIFIIFQLLFYLGFDPLPTNSDSPWYAKLIGALVFIALPCYLLSRFLWKKIEHISIPTDYNPQLYRKGQRLFWVGFLLGWFLMFSVGITLTSYLRGIEIDLFGIILNGER